MTTPQERLRALRWGAETLRDIATDGSAPADLAERAKWLTFAYPSPDLIDAHVLEGDKPFPPDWTTAFLDAGRLFDVLSRSNKGSDRTRRCLLSTQRHYPSPNILEIMGEEPPAFPWLPGPGDPLE